MSEILLIAPVPTHPSATGASARIRHMAQALPSLGHRAHFLYLQQTRGEVAPELREYWGDRLHVFRGRTPRGLFERARRKVLRLTAKTFRMNLSADAYFDPTAARYVEALLARWPFDVVVVSYVFYSRLLELVPGSTRKLIDTHDVFSERYRLYTEHGQRREFFSTSRAEEGRGLDRADAIVAVQEADAAHFRTVARPPVHVVGHLAPLAIDAAAGRDTRREPDTRRGLLFVGSPMGINVHGVHWFIERVFPAVREAVPDAELWLVGGICDRIRRPGPGVRRFGFVESPADLYRRAAAVINPQRFGTGLSIKSVDALRHGRPLLTTATGARGIEEGAGTAFLQADSAAELARQTIELLRDPALGAALAARAIEFATVYHRRQLQALAEVLGA